MAGEYFGNRYFPKGYFPDGYFGIEGEVDPNAMRGTAAGVATVTGTLTGLGDGSMVGSAAGAASVAGTLTSTGTPEVVEPIRTGTGGGGFWVGHSDDGLVVLAAKRAFKVPRPRFSEPRVHQLDDLVAGPFKVPLPVLSRPKLGQDDIREIKEIMDIIEVQKVLRLLRAA